MIRRFPQKRLLKSEIGWKPESVVSWKSIIKVFGGGGSGSKVMKRSNTMSAEVKYRRTCCNYIYYHFDHYMMPERRGENMKVKP